MVDCEMPWLKIQGTAKETNGFGKTIGKWGWKATKGLEGVLVAGMWG